MRVLGIESSCDETGIAIYDDKLGLMAHALYTQIETHKHFGGVVPELASRDHVKYIVPLINSALAEANTTKLELDAIAYTAGPGLIGALLAGASFAKSFAFGLNIPALAINHLEAHILVAKLENPKLDFPFVALLVSGGHTQLIKATALGQYELLGETLDDAVGEAFDKTAKLMGLPYPGGAELALCAESCKEDNLPYLPRPMLDRPGLDFSFSGLKTHALNLWNKSEKDLLNRSIIAKAFQNAVVDVLIEKCKRAILQLGCPQLVVAGGVSANRALRGALIKLMDELPGEVYFPALKYCTDNGAMIAYTGCLHLLNKSRDKSLAINVKARWPL